MNIELPVSNIHNSIRFYNRLLDERPVKLDYETVSYCDNSCRISLDLHEFNTVISSRAFQHVVPEKNVYLDMLQRSQSLINRSPGTTCRVAHDHFSITDPDGHVWVIAQKHLDQKQLDQVLLDHANTCYLEPFYN